MPIPDAELPAPWLPSGRDMLAESTPLPARLHLSHALHTPDAQRANARFEAVFFSVAAVIPALLVISVLKMMRVDRGPLIVIFVAIILGVALRTFFKERLDRTLAWEQTKWLDFTDRTWRSRKEYVHESMATETLSVPFESLVLICHNASIEERINFGVDLCQRSDLGEYCSYPSECMHHVYYSPDEQAVHEYALKLGEQWAVDCWNYAPPRDGGLQRISPRRK